MTASKQDNIMKIIAKIPENTTPYICGERLMACEMTREFKFIRCVEFFKTYEEAKAFTNENPEFKWKSSH